MKNLIFFFAFIFILPINCVGSSSVASTQSATVYVIQKSASSPNVLVVHIDRAKTATDTKLILRGISMGISEQVNNMVCDGKSIKEKKPGTWAVPGNCEKIQWQVPLFESGTKLASSQQSMKSGNFILFSEISSLPRLQDAAKREILQISIPNVKTIFPDTISSGEIILPGIQEAPLFVLLNPAVVGTHKSNLIKLTYLLDNPASVSKLPSASAHMKGLEWLNTIIPSKTKENFNVAWLAIPAKKLTLSGATGKGILLTNYLDDKKLPAGKAILLYVGLHEAFHQFAMHYPEQPTWVSESLASYYGVRALRVALPNDPGVSKLTDRFLKGADHFQDGLIAINRKVKAGDSSEYGAFYTKGLAFWMAVDEALKQTRNDSLDKHLPAIFQTQYDKSSEPLDLRKRLNLSPKTWASLRHRFLD